MNLILLITCIFCIGIRSEYDGKLVTGYDHLWLLFLVPCPPDLNKQKDEEDSCVSQSTHMQSKAQVCCSYFQVNAARLVSK